MNKNIKYFGLDISHLVFDVTDSQGNYYQFKNKLHGEAVLGEPSKAVVRSLKRSLKHTEKELLNLEARLLHLVKETHKDLFTRITTAIMLIVLTDGFERFSSASELCSYAGLTPVIRQSGNSVKGRPRISKMGNQKLRNLLFMCSFSACKYNKACKAIYERLVAKGKNKKLALIAVCNKLLKLAFAIAKSGLIFDKKYKSTLVKN